MDTEKTIPLVIGVTGHRTIRQQDRPALAAAVKVELEKLRSLCPHSKLVMLNSLAEGADLSAKALSFSSHSLQMTFSFTDTAKLR